ncbi:hypothetical protein [Kordia sp.]|uniref:hypothetical protein n=1 Tax=Kordia sp. TaxID=1965332 RepID=UPI003D2BE656
MQSPKDSHDQTGEWFTCSVNSIGPIENNGVYVMLTDDGGKFNKTWFYTSPNISALVNETGLSAIQNGKKVYVELTGSSPASSVLRFHLLA